MYFDLVIIGAGISGLSAALASHNRGLENVLLLEYEKEIGGFQSKLYHLPEFFQEKKLLTAASELPYETWTNATVIGFFPGEEGENHQLFVQQKTGTVTVEAKIVLIASGSLQQPREAFKIPGTRPFGVMTSLLASNLVDQGYLPGDNVVMFERTRIDSAVKRKLESQGITIQSLSLDEYNLVKINGFGKVESIEVEHVPTGTHKMIPCDTILYSGGRIPSTFFLKQTAVERNEHLAVVVDEQGQTSVPNVFAVGSCTDKGDDQHFTSKEMAETVMQRIIQVFEKNPIQ